jgi:hypothetical protein
MLELNKYIDIKLHYFLFPTNICKISRSCRQLSPISRQLSIKLEALKTNKLTP